MNYLAEIWRVGTYLALPCATIFGLAVGLSVVVNGIARARVLNPWLWGCVAMICLALFVVVTTSSRCTA